MRGPYQPSVTYLPFTALREILCHPALLKKHLKCLMYITDIFRKIISTQKFPSASIFPLGSCIYTPLTHSYNLSTHTFINPFIGFLSHLPYKYTCTMHSRNSAVKKRHSSLSWDTQLNVPNSVLYIILYLDNTYWVLTVYRVLSWPFYIYYLILAVLQENCHFIDQETETEEWKVILFRPCP